MWTYSQTSGILKLNGQTEGIGYSGYPPYCNDPQAENMPDKGPIPRGLYSIGKPFTDAEKGEMVMHLTPFAANTMFDRSGFLIHGDSVQHPGKASCGCIVLAHSLRLQIYLSKDTQLEVVD